MRKFTVTGMSCAACSSRVERAVSSLGGVERCAVNLLSGVLSVWGDESSESIISAVTAAGYGAAEYTNQRKNVNNNLQNNSKKVFARLISSAALLLPLMYITMGHVMLGAPLPSFIAERAHVIGIIELILSLAVLLINYKFFVRGAKGLFVGAPNMDTLVSLGSGASFVYSTVMVVKMILAPEEAMGYLHGLYFESAAMILTLITVGKLLEERAKGRTTDAVRSLMSLAPKLATVERDGAEVTVPAEDVLVGEVFILKPGDAVPVDGVVIEGESSVSEAALTGESVPCEKSVGDTVLAATVNQSGYLRCRATKVGEDTAISAVIRLVEDASATKAPIARVADKVSGIFVPAVLLVALVTFGIWCAVGAGIGYALGRGISVLVISCPCALGLATPVAITVGAGVGARRGILYKSAEAIELAGKARIVVLDKTGTVTEGKPSVVDVLCYGAEERELISLAYSLESKSEHPLARAVVEYAACRGAELRPCSEFSLMAGAGVRGMLFGEELLGVSFGYYNEKFGATERERADYERLSGEGKTPLFFTRGGSLLGIIAVSDKLREDSPSAIAELRRLGMRVVMLTGDNAICAAAIAKEAGIDEVYSGMLPDGKAETVKKLSEEGGVIMVGDGINDAPSLALADVGAAIGGGTDIAIESADLVLMRDRLSDVPRAVRLGRAVLKNIRENLFWAFIYNTVGIPLAAGAFVAWLGWEMSPMIGALAMSLSSFSVVMNALRLNFFERKNAPKQLTSPKGEDGGKPSAEKNCCGAVNFDDQGCERKACRAEKTEGEEIMKITVKVEGMMCPHCEARVRSAIEAMDGVVAAEVSHVSGEAVVTVKDGAVADAIVATVEAQGYKAYLA
ncbi:MAG: heavy metal translocating P-type ATPase [Clostridia bacterium]|nr:heavy metal translocating P-type ATPase [Clostridia bacterium]